jgi:hypothetical protein
MTALFNQRSILIQPNAVNSGGNNSLSYALSDSTLKWAAGFAAPKAITLAKVAVRALSKTGTPVAYDVRIESDNGAGRPSGSLAWANATSQIPTNQAAGWTSELTLTSSGALTVGTVYHIVVQPATDPASANYINLHETGVMSDLGAIVAGNMTYWASRYNGSAWSTGSGAPLFVCVADDGTTKFGDVFASTTLDSVPTLTNTAWYGMKFVAPFTGTLWGAGFGCLDSTSATTVEAKLIDNSNTVLASAPLEAGVHDILTGRGNYKLFFFDTPTQLTAGQTYRVVFKDAAGAMRMDVFGCDSTYQALKPGADQYVYTKGTSSDGTASPTSWTDNDAGEVADFTLMFSEASSGGGGSGGSGQRVISG